MDPSSWLAFFRILTLGSTLLAFISGIGVYCYTKKLERDKQAEIQHLRSGKDQLAIETTQLKARDEEKSRRIEELLQGQQKLAAENTELAGKVDASDKDSANKERKITELEAKARKAIRGVAVTYDYGGTRRETGPGRVVAVVGQETVVYADMVRLEREGRFDELVKLCKAQIEKTPAWLTPHMFLGVYYANSGRTKEAIREFAYVVENAAGDPEYAKAAQYLEKLKAK